MEFRVVQSTDELSPEEVVDKILSGDLQVKYRVSWKDVWNGYKLERRELVEEKDISLEPFDKEEDQEVYMYIVAEFGPDLEEGDGGVSSGPFPKIMNPIYVQLDGNLQGITPTMLFPMREVRRLNVEGCKEKYFYVAYQSTINPPYYRPITLLPDGTDCEWVKLKFTGADSGQHFSNPNRKSSGKQLDSKPQTVARVNPDDEPYYNWTGYESGVDENHKVRLFQPDQYEPNNKPESATPISLWEKPNLVTGLCAPFFESWCNRPPLHIMRWVFNLSLDRDDVDFFTVENPGQGKKCEPHEIGNCHDIYQPAYLEISVSGASAIVTVYDKSDNPYIIRDNVARIELPDENLGEEIKFKITPKEGSCSKFCYGLIINYTSCYLFLFCKQPPDLPDFLREIKEKEKAYGIHIIYAPLEGGWEEDYFAGRFDPDAFLMFFEDLRPSLPPIPFVYPSNPGIVESISGGDPPAEIPPEYIVFNWPEDGKFQMNIQAVVPPNGDLDFILLDGQKNIVAEAEEIFPLMLGVQQSGSADSSCGGCTTQSGLIYPYLGCFFIRKYYILEATLKGGIYVLYVKGNEKQPEGQYKISEEGDEYYPAYGST
jgi:hypothetical protein